MISVESQGSRSPRSISNMARQARQAAAGAKAEISASPRQSTRTSTAAESADRDVATGSASFGAEEQLAEFRELASSAGAEIAGEFMQRRARLDPATLVGQGKLQEISGAAASAGATLILFDHDLTPSQQRNIEKEVKVRVIDRTQLILDIFARHARTREGQLQVELAQLEYMLPRLAGRGVEMSQLGGGIGTRGPGETQLETDKRKINRRIRQMQQQLESVRRTRAQQRQRRESAPIPTVALVGYTNAGKSTLFNALTNSAVLASAKMFATLDPTIRGITLPSRRRALLSDTVGFIRNLPHTLVTSFRATLEEVQRASLILHVADASSPVTAEQQAQVEKVLLELEVQNKPQIRVMNKIDLLGDRELVYPASGAPLVYISAFSGAGLYTLLEKIDDMLVADPIIVAAFQVPQSEGKALAWLEGESRILSRRYVEGAVELRVRAPKSLVGKLRRFVIPDRGAE